jgi:hypothetical protein
MIFSTGSTFIFGSWIYEADDDGKLQGHLLEDSARHEDLAISTTTTDQLARGFTRLVMSDPTQISWPTNFDSNSGSASEMESYPGSFCDVSSSFPLGLHNMASTYQEFNLGFLQSSFQKPDPFPLGLNNMATSYQALLQGSTSPIRRMPVRRAQGGLVLTITSQDYIVHWLGSISEDNGTWIVGTTTVLPYQGDSIYDAKASTEVLNNSDRMETSINNRTLHTREVFMVRRPRSPLVPLEALDVRSLDESEFNISPFA